MSVRSALTMAGMILLNVLVILPPASADVLAQPDVASGYLTPGRTWTLVAVPLALVGVVFGWLALARPGGRTGLGNSRNRASISVVTALAGTVIGAFVVILAEGGPGTGSGIVGGVIALVVGMVGVTLGGLALARSRRTRAGRTDT